MMESGTNPNLETSQGATMLHHIVTGLAWRHGDLDLRRDDFLAMPGNQPHQDGIVRAALPVEVQTRLGIAGLTFTGEGEAYELTVSRRVAPKTYESHNNDHTQNPIFIDIQSPDAADKKVAFIEISRTGPNIGLTAIYGISATTGIVGTPPVRTVTVGVVDQRRDDPIFHAYKTHDLYGLVNLLQTDLPPSGAGNTEITPPANKSPLIIVKAAELRALGRLVVSLDFSPRKGSP